MTIFESTISDILIGGLSKLETHETEGGAGVWFSFELYLPQYKISFVSDTYSSTDADQTAKEAWLEHFRDVKQNILQLLSPNPATLTKHFEAVNTSYSHLNDTLDNLSAILESASAVEQAAAVRLIGNVRLHAGSLKKRALTTCL